MIKILLINKSQDFFNYIAHTASDLRVEVVSPNPQIADHVRKRFDAVESHVESITISKFIKNQLNMLSDEDILENYKGKSELILLLGAIWKKLDIDKDYMNFKRAFNLLTEFRSFTMSSQVLETVLENYDEDISSKVLWLHRLLDEMKIVDEHKSYFLLAERLREGNLPAEYEAEKTIIFYGFDFLTASQVDMLKSFGLRDDVIIPCYKEVFNKVQVFDWINWFDDHNKEVLDISSEIDQISPISLTRFPRGYFAKALSSKNEPFDLVLGTKKLTRENTQEIPIEKLSVKVPVDLFSIEHNQCFERLREFTKLEEEIEISELEQFLIKSIDDLKKENRFREVKVHLVILTSLKDWRDISSDNELVGDYDLDILLEASLLNLPRINSTSLLKEDDFSLVKTVFNVEDLENRKVVLAIHSNHGSVKGVNANFSENVEKYLSSIGPIRRSEFEVNTLKCRIEEFITKNKVEMFIEDEILEQDMTWSMLLKSVPMKLEQTPVMKKNIVEYQQENILNADLTRVSASRLQKYMECPRKYYYQFVSKIMPFIDFENELSVMELGQIQHRLIETYFAKTKEINESLYSEILNKTILEYSSKKKISDELLNEYLVEVRSYTWSIINTISKLIVDSDYNASFEVDFSQKDEGLGYNGSIDCILTNKSNNQKVILDFKRSNYSFSTYLSLTNFEQIQLWFYLTRLLKTNSISLDDQIIVGYIDLSENKNSLFVSNDKEFAKLFTSQTGFKKVKVLDTFDEIVLNYNDLELELIKNLKEDAEFETKPLTTKSCGICAMKNVCPREPHVISK